MTRSWQIERFAFVLGPAICVLGCAHPPPTRAPAVSTQPALAPIPVSAERQPFTRSRLAAGPGFACAIDAQGGVRCWGHNDQGQLGDGTRQTSATAVRVQNVAHAVSIRASEHMSCALDATGKLSCWGDAQEPALVAGIDGAVDVALSYRLACVVLRSKKVACAAFPNRYQENSATQTPTVFPVRGVEDAIGIAATRGQVCVLRDAGQIACFPTAGLLGDETPTKEASPAPSATVVEGVTNVAQMAGAYDRLCAAFRDGRAGCWMDSQGAAATPAFIENVSGATSVTVGEFHACALQLGGAVLCWGSNLTRELGIAEYPKGAEAVRAERVDDVGEVAVGDGFSCVTLRSRVLCWGSAEFGELGNGKSTESDIPVEVPGVEGAAQVVAGMGFSCANEGHSGIWCWGSGIASATSSAEPAPLTGFPDATRLSAVDDGVCAYSDQAFLGCLSRIQTVQDPSATPSVPAALREARAVTGIERGAALWKTGKVTFFEPAPDTRGGVVQKPVRGLDDAIDLVGTDSVACALRRTGQVSCAFSDADNYDASKVIKAVPIPQIRDAISIANFNAGFAVVHRSGHVTTFGYDFGRHATIEDPFARGVTQVTLGLSFACALLSNGSVECSGYNAQGQLGTGDLLSSTSYMLTDPKLGGATVRAWVPVKNLQGVRSVAAGLSHACAALADGRVFCWGSNNSHELGAGSLPFSLEPVEVIGLEVGGMP